jgi:integrase
MARQRTGTIEYVETKGATPGHYKVRITCPNGSRPWFHLPPASRSPEGETEARRLAAEYSDRATRENVIPSPPKRRPRPGAAPGEFETFAEYSERWFADRDRRGMSSINTDKGRFRNHVLPVIGHIPLREVTKQDGKRLVAALDDKVLDDVIAGSHALTIWGLVSRLFDDAVNHKREELVVLSDNPIAGIQPPERGIEKAKQWLYPSEASQLLACDAVPLRWRELYALMIYLYARPGELAELRCDDVNLEQGYVSITRALEFRENVIEPTKNGVTRRVPIVATLIPLLRILLARVGGTGLLVQNKHPNKKVGHGFPPLEALSGTFRKHLKRAGVIRPELFADTQTSKNIRFYDLRATGITWEVFAGTDHVLIQRRAGHVEFETTNGYIRQAVDVGLPPGEPPPFAPLPDRLLESSLNRLQKPLKFVTGGIDSKIQASPTGFEPGRERPKTPSNRGISTHADEPTKTIPDAKEPLAVSRDGSETQHLELTGVVESALARALTLAAEAQRWDIVEQIARELGERRRDRTPREEARPSNVVPLPVDRRS